MLDSGRPDRRQMTASLRMQSSPALPLVPVVPTVHWSRVPDQQMSRADFVTQLIATAEYAPQTRSLRRATPADAGAAYRANQHQSHGAGVRTRQNHLNRKSPRLLSTRRRVRRRRRAVTRAAVPARGLPATAQPARPRDAGFSVRGVPAAQLRRLALRPAAGDGTDGVTDGAGAGSN